MGTTVNTGADPSVQAGLASLLTMADPKTAAEGALFQARTRNFDAETGLNTAKTTALNDRRKYLGDDAALLAAGYTPRQILAFRMTGAENGIADLFNGVRTDTGTNMLGSDPRKASVLLNFGAGVDPDSAFSETEAKSIRDQKYQSDLAKAVATAKVASVGADGRAANRAATTAKNALVDKDEKFAFTPEQVSGSARQAIVDLYSQGGKDAGDYVKLDEGVVKKILDTQQTLISTGLSTRSRSLSDALAALGYVNSENKAERYEVEEAVTDASGWFTGDDVTRTLKPSKSTPVDIGELEKLIMTGVVPAEAVDMPNYTEVPLDQARDVLPMIRDRAATGDRFKLGNRIYEKMQMPDGSMALVAVM